MSAYAYPAHLAEPDEDGWITVEFRGIPAVTQGRDRNEALANASDALSTALWYMLRESDPIPAPTVPRPGELMVEPEPAVVLKLELLKAVKGERGEAARVAQGLGISHKDARRLLDPRKINRADRLARALILFGRVTQTIVREHDPVGRGSRTEVARARRPQTKTSGPGRAKRHGG